MLSSAIKPINFENESWNKESWLNYRERIGLSDDEAVQQFYRQVFYDHFEHFNEHYPDLCLDDYQIALEYLSAEEAADKISFFGNEVMDKWGQQFDAFQQSNHQYLIYQEMSKTLVAPFSPILIEPTALTDSGWRVYGRPLHLIEGTHRVSYLRRMLERQIIDGKSMHQFVILRPLPKA